MAQPATTPKIEELRFKIKTDPKSRLFFPLAEELRKIGQFAEAEQVLHVGLGSHPTYLSAWVSLGRVQRDLKNEPAAIESLSKALQLDPGNVVAARLLADSYLAVGEKLEALKKYKLVHALLPGDEELEGIIERLDNELNPITIAAPPPPPPPPPEPEQIVPAPDESPFADEEPMTAAHDESPFEQPVPDFTEAALEVEAPKGIQVEFVPMTAEVAAPVEPPPSPVEESDVFAPAEPAIAEPQQEDIANTLTMADLYARQGLTDDARHIYESILQRDPNNAVVHDKLDALNPPPPAPQPAASAASSRNTKVERLESWLHKVARREAGHV